MFLEAFTDELVHQGRPALVKAASIFAPRPDRLLERMGAIGGLTGAGMHAMKSGKAGLTADPYDSPGGSMAGEGMKGAVAGLTIGALLKLMGRIAERKRR